MGTLPSSLALATGIVYFAVHDNVGISGTLPTEFALWNRSESSDSAYQQSILAFNNSLAGTLPTEYGFLQNFFFLRFQNNAKLGGTIPSQYGLTNIYTLHFDQSFTGTIPSELSLSTYMNDFLVDCNGISGTLPIQFYKWGTNLASVYVAANSISGDVYYHLFILY